MVEIARHEERTDGRVALLHNQRSTAITKLARQMEAFAVTSATYPRYALDLGNTTLKLLCQRKQHETPSIQEKWVLQETTPLKLANILTTWYGQHPPKTTVAWLSTNPTMAHALFCNTLPYWLLPINKQWLLNSQSNGGVDFSYYQHSWETMGLDRILNIWHYATQHPTQPAMLINAGTCTTVDVVLSHKRYGGGAIIPGAMAWQHSIPNTAPHLPHATAMPNTPFIPPANTLAAVTQGQCYPYGWGIVGYAQQLLHYYKVDSTTTPIVITGGGNATWLYTVLQATLETTSHLPLPHTPQQPMAFYETAIFAAITHQHSGI